jgi:hypothetical protein
MTEATAITTVEELPAELREELVGKRKAGTTLAELKKAFPQVAPDVIRAVLPPLPKGTETKPEAPAKPARTRRAKTAPATDAPKPKRTRTSEGNVQTASSEMPARSMAKAFNDGVAKGKAHKAKTEQPAKTERKPVDAKVAQKVVTMRGKLDGKGRPASWAKIGYALKLVPEGAPKSQAGDAARRAYRQVKGADAPTGPSDY